MTTRTRMTVDEYWARYDEDLRKTELIDGEVVVTEPNYPHGRLQAVLIGALTAWEQGGPGHGEVAGPTEVLLGDHDAYGPDLVVVAPQPQLNERERLAALPLVAVEIRSPTTWRYDIGRKKAMYEDRGLPELWLVDHVAGVLLVFRRSSPAATTFDVALELTRDDVLTSPLLPGFAFALGELL